MRQSAFFFLLASFFFLLVSSCGKKKEEVITQLNEPLPPLVFPIDNPIWKEKVELGKALFFDRLLSRDSTISCSSCHFPQFAYSDTIPISKGAHGRIGFRNAPALFNLAWKPRLFKDGGVRNLELQVLAPLLEPNEMDFGSEELLNRLEKSDEYISLFSKAFDSLPTLKLAVQALASFERTLIYNESKFDRFLRNEVILLEEELIGMRLFYSPELACSSCHKGVLFTDFQYHDIGMPPSEDVGRYRVSLDSLDKFKFETPSLKAVSLSAPYMHDGSIKDLRAVVDWYNQAAEVRKTKDKRIRALNLNSSEKDALVAFLNCL